jgi:hypothetical protein
MYNSHGQQKIDWICISENNNNDNVYIYMLNIPRNVY